MTFHQPQMARKPLLGLLILILTLAPLLACGQAGIPQEAPPQSEPSIPVPHPPVTSLGAGAPAPTHGIGPQEPAGAGRAARPARAPGAAGAPAAAAQSAPYQGTPVEISKEIEVLREVEKGAGPPQDMMYGAPASSSQSAPEGGQGQQGAPHLDPTSQPWPGWPPEIGRMPYLTPTSHSINTLPPMPLPNQRQPFIKSWHTPTPS